MHRRLQVNVLAMALWTAAACGANVEAAEQYPTRPVRFVVPYAPGGGSDIIARVVGLKVGEALGQSFVIDNRPGAASMVATEIVARAPADGYTLILADVPHTINVSTYANPTYDAIKDFAPIMLVGSAPQIMVAHPSFAYNSLKELLSLPRAQTEKIAMGTSGNGGSPHMTYELLRLRTGLTLNHIPYKGGGPATSDALAGQIPIAFNAAPASMNFLRSNRLKGLGITSAARHPLMPTIPTFIEAGVPNFAIAHWYGVLAPARTPAPVIKALHRELQKALQAPDVKERFASLAIDIVGNSPEEFTTIIASDVKRWHEVVAKAGIRIE
jgi:tripartite-type tricarboxylate transporter receptor subunit TctC